MSNTAHSAQSIELIHTLCIDYEKNNMLSQDPRDNPNVKRGLRNMDGTGVMAGYTQIGSVQGYVMMDGEKIPQEGHLYYRGYDVMDLVAGSVTENRFGFGEVCYLLLFGSLPTAQEYSSFRDLLDEYTALPNNFFEDMILRCPSRDIMNVLGRSVLALYSYDPNPDDTSLENMMRQSLELIARFPLIAAHAYSVKRHYFDNDSLYIHRPVRGMSIAENFLHAARQDKQFTAQEARLLDICLTLHAEHGGGNNSAFATRVLSSTGTDTYSAIAGAIGSLKGPKHGGANRRVVAMFDSIKAGVKNWRDDGEIADYLNKILDRQAGDGSGLIYGMGHAVYTLSDPRAVALKYYARDLAEQYGYGDELFLMEAVERLTPELMAARGQAKVMCANVDMYSGFVYKLLNIPPELYTALFAMSRIAGWCSHRIEEALTGGRIIRPAYKAVAPMESYVPLEQR